MRNASRVNNSRINKSKKESEGSTVGKKRQRFWGTTATPGDGKTGHVSKEIMDRTTPTIYDVHEKSMLDLDRVKDIILRQQLTFKEQLYSLHQAVEIQKLLVATCKDIDAVVRYTLMQSQKTYSNEADKEEDLNNVVGMHAEEEKM